MLRFVEGDIFTYNHQAYGHGVNTLGRMGSGIALDFKSYYPEMFLEYRDKYLKKELFLGDVYFYQSLNSLPSVFNLVTQEKLHKAEPAALCNAVEKMYIMAKKRGIHDIGIPKIGIGHGRLDEESLLHALVPFLRDSTSHITIYEISR